MRFKAKLRIIVFISLIILLALACSLPQADNNPQNNSQSGNNSQDQSNVSNDENNQTEDTPAPDTNNTSAGDAEPTQTETPVLPTPTVAHTNYPSQPGSSVWLAESSSKAYASEGRSVADAFFSMLLERPFTSQAMVYQGYLDIIRAELSVTTPYVYVTIFMEEEPPTAVNAHYGIEIDADQDGRGDWLVYGLVPPDTEWTSAGVRVYQDSNNDVGGPIPLEADGALTTLDGYDELLFDQGYDTTDPDMAWIRRDPNNNSRVQIAFKYAVIGSADTFLWGVWADAGPVEPTWFDYNDHYTLAQAGSPLSNSPEFPLNELASVDNSCRWSYGFTPIGDEPGICKVPPTPTPTATPAPGQLRGLVFDDLAYNGVRDSGELGMSGWTVTLGSGACPSSGYASTTTNGVGIYQFTDIPAGTYCVTVQITLSTGCAGWHTLTGKTKTITLPAGGTISVPDMGFSNFVC